MKTQLFILTIAIAFAMTSCQEDGINGTVAPDTIQNTHVKTTGSGADAQATIQFDFNENVYLITELKEITETKTDNRIIKPQVWRITGYGDSEIENRGSWYADVDLEYNSGSDAINGTVTFEFPDYGDRVTLVAFGGPVLERINDDKDHLSIKLALQEGTGRFAKKKFEGGASIALTTAWKDNGELITTLNANGLFIDNGQ
jgi:hypothetical protein